MSPHQQQLLQQQTQQQQQRNGFPYSNRSFPSPTTPSNNGSEPPPFHPFHADKIPNHSLADTANTFPSIQQVRISQRDTTLLNNVIMIHELVIDAVLVLGYVPI